VDETGIPEDEFAQIVHRQRMNVLKPSPRRQGLPRTVRSHKVIRNAILCIQ